MPGAMGLGWVGAGLGARGLGQREGPAVEGERYLSRVDLRADFMATTRRPRRVSSFFLFD